jgi:DNA-binding winged helix-turn-helix (wHTH) protein
MVSLTALADRVDLLEETLRWMRQSTVPTHRREWRGLHLTRAEWIVLDALASGKTCSHASLRDRFEIANLSEAPCSVTSIKVRVLRLRRKLDVLLPPIVIETVHGIGYRLDAANLGRLTAREIAPVDSVRQTQSDSRRLELVEMTEYSANS